MLDFILEMAVKEISAVGAMLNLCIIPVVMKMYALKMVTSLLKHVEKITERDRLLQEESKQKAESILNTEHSKHA